MEPMFTGSVNPSSTARRRAPRSTSATRGFSSCACLPARISAARQTSPSEPSTVSGATASTLFNAAMALTGPASLEAVAAVNAANVEWSSARTPCVTT